MGREGEGEKEGRFLVRGDWREKKWVNKDKIGIMRVK